METESYIQSQLKKLDNKCTIFVIAYRISSIRDADLILVMDNGRIMNREPIRNWWQQAVIMRQLSITSMVRSHRKF